MCSMLATDTSPMIAQRCHVDELVPSQIEFASDQGLIESHSTANPKDSGTCLNESSCLRLSVPL